MVTIVTVFPEYVRANVTTFFKLSAYVLNHYRFWLIFSENQEFRFIQDMAKVHELPGQRSY